MGAPEPASVLGRACRAGMGRAASRQRSHQRTRNKETLQEEAIELTEERRTLGAGSWRLGAGRAEGPRARGGPRGLGCGASRGSSEASLPASLWPACSAAQRPLAAGPRRAPRRLWLRAAYLCSFPQFELLTVQSHRCARRALSVLTVAPRTPRTQHAVGVPSPELEGPFPGGESGLASGAACRSSQHREAEAARLGPRGPGAAGHQPRQAR